MYQVSNIFCFCCCFAIDFIKTLKKARSNFIENWTAIARVLLRQREYSNAHIEDQRKENKRVDVNIELGSNEEIRETGNV